MTVETGRMLSHYRLEEKLGEGGMGVVWRALDTTLDREVAVKILPGTFAQHPERLERFEREAKVLASLHHPNIAVLHGLDQDQGVRFLVMELVEGEDLSKRLARGPLPTLDAMKLCAQIARALQAAHDRNVVHRDLKPANIVLTASGEAKVLDFGLAKVLDPETPDSDETSAPTVTTGGTMAGVILGTAAYMSPEQARGKPTDRRTDIWSFGCVLHECLTGVSEFKGDTMSDSIGAILHKSPEWDSLPGDLPVTVQWLLRRCLTKDRDNRLHDIADARIELEQAIVDPQAGGLVVAEGTEAAQPAWLWPVAAAVLVALAAVVSWWLKPVPEMERTTAGLSFSLPVPQDRVEFTLSPDGTNLVYRAVDAQAEIDGEPEHRLWLRRMDSFVPTPIPGTEGANKPKFSPDGQTVAYQVDRSGGKPHQADLRVVSLDGRPPLTVATNATDHAGLSWLFDGEIVYVDHENERRLLAISRGGGEPRTYAEFPEDSHFTSFRFAGVTGGGEWVVSGSLTEGRHTVLLIDRVSGEEFALMRDAKRPRILRDGSLLFIRAGALLLAKLDLSVSPPSLVGDVQAVMGGGADPDEGIRRVEVSDAGHLAFVTGLGADENRSLMTLDGEGKVEPLLEAAGAYRAPMGFSPDGRLLAVAHRTEETFAELWVVELDTGAKRPMAPDEMLTMGAAWIPGDRLVFTSWAAADQGRILVREMHRNSTPVPLFEDWPDDLRLEGGYVAFDGTNLAFEAVGERGDVDIWIRPVDGSAPARLLVGSQANERCPQFSPDRQWLAYTSNESGRAEVYLRRHHPDGEPGAYVLKVSRTGGFDPRWSADGGELFFTSSSSQLLRVRVESFDPLRVSEPEVLVSDPRELRALGLYGRSRFVPMPDGERLAFVQNPDVDTKVKQIDLVLNWAEQLVP
ncbi:MAG: protein kinase [Dehalococcoidia bacterium]